jgi:hypothetical protein
VKDFASSVVYHSLQAGGGGAAAAATIMQFLIALLAAELPEESVTLAVNGKDPTAVVSVPVIAPVEAFKFSPGGSDPELIKNE